MFWGVEGGNVDAKGRLKLSASIRRLFKQRYPRPGAGEGVPVKDAFVTSLDGREIKVFPTREWAKVQEWLSARPGDGAGKSNGKQNNRLLANAMHYGKSENIDAQGRVLLPAMIRSSSGISGPVKIQWRIHHLIVMSEADYNAFMKSNELTPDDLEYAANLGL